MEQQEQLTEFKIQLALPAPNIEAVSYTHLDVYKRQILYQIML